MRSFLFAAVSALALTGVSAAPTASAELEERQFVCMSSSTANILAQGFADLIGKPFNHTLARTIFTETFHDYSDSVIELINSGCPNGPVALGSPTFSSRKAFVKGQSGQKPIPFEILNVWPSCNSVTFRWRSSNPGAVNPEQFVTGIIVLETTSIIENFVQSWQIATTYSEFNSGAWLYDLGVFKPSNCSA